MPGQTSYAKPPKQEATCEKRQKPNEQRKRLDADFTWEQFAKNCVLNEYALVVGPEAILNRDINPEAEGNSKKLPLDLWSLATEGTQESDRTEYKHL